MSATAPQVLRVLREQAKAPVKQNVSQYDLFEYLHGEQDLFGKMTKISSVRIKDKVEIQPYGGKYPVSWVLNESAASCMRCQSAFTFFNRRHHCRFCGFVICGDCSVDSLEIDVLKDVEQESRRCKACRDAKIISVSSEPAVDSKTVDEHGKHKVMNAEHRVEKTSQALRAEEERKKIELEAEKRRKLEAFLSLNGGDYENSAEYATLSVAERSELTALAAERKKQEVEQVKRERQQEMAQTLCVSDDQADARTAKQRAEDALQQSRLEAQQKLEQDKQQRRELFLSPDRNGSTQQQPEGSVTQRFDVALQQQAETEQKRIEALKNDPARIPVPYNTHEPEAAEGAVAVEEAMKEVEEEGEDDDEDDDDAAVGGGGSPAALQQLSFLGTHNHHVMSEEEVQRKIQSEAEHQEAAEAAEALEDTLLDAAAATVADTTVQSRRASHRLSQGHGGSKPKPPLALHTAVDGSAETLSVGSTPSGLFFDSPFAGQTPHVEKTMSFGSEEEIAQRAAELQSTARDLALDLQQHEPQQKGDDASVPPAAATATTEVVEESTVADSASVTELEVQAEEVNAVPVPVPVPASVTVVVAGTEEAADDNDDDEADSNVGSRSVSMSGNPAASNSTTNNNSSSNNINNNSGNAGSSKGSKKNNGKKSKGKKGK